MSDSIINSLASNLRPIHEKFGSFFRDEKRVEIINTVKRWIVNYIRHKLTNYDENLYNLSGRVGCHKAYSEYRKAVLTKIASFYPKYSQECHGQMVDRTDYGNL